MKESKTYVEIRLYGNGEVVASKISKEEAEGWIDEVGVHYTNDNDDKTYQFFISESIEGAMKLFTEYTDGIIKRSLEEIDILNTRIESIRKTIKNFKKGNNIL